MQSIIPGFLMITCCSPNTTWKSDSIFHFQPEHDFNFFKLDTLEATGWYQVISEVEEIERCHSFKDADLLVKQLLNFVDSVQSLNDSTIVAGIKGRFIKRFLY